MPWAARPTPAGLELAVVADPKLAASDSPKLWDGIPGVLPGLDAVPTLPSVEEAVGRGLTVAVPKRGRGNGELGRLQELAAPFRTAEQLAALNARPRAPAESFRFAVIGDAEPGRFWWSRRLFNMPNVFWGLLKKADESAPDFILQLGDMVSRGTIGRFASFFRLLSYAAPKAPLLTVIGNHDRHKPHGVSNDAVYRASFGSTDYLFDRGGWRFVVLDSSAGRVTKDQLTWLRTALEPGRRAVVFTHIPPAPLGQWTDYGKLKGVGGFWEGSKEFMSLMSERRVERVYMGHVHGLGAAVVGGVRYVLTGGGGSPLFPGAIPRPARVHHWLEVSVGPDGLHETVHMASGLSFRL